MKAIGTFAVLLCVAGFPSSTFALSDEGLPLRIENLLAPTGGSEISLGISHTASDAFPRRFDLLSASMGYSYGLNKNAELALNLRGVYVDERASFGRFSYADTQTRISTLDAELGHRFSPENETPGIYGRFGITLLENRAQEGEDFEALSGDFSASLALYRTYDPIVLRLSIAYRNTVGRQTTDGDYYDSGDTVTISPTVSFAVNHLISISAIGDVQVIQKNEINSRNIAGDYRRTIVRAGLGLSLSISDRTTLYASGSLVASGQDEASVGLFIRHRLRRQSVAGKIPKPDMGEIFNEPQPSQLPKN